MARLLAYNLAFFLLPFVVYGVYIVLTRRSLGTSDDWSLKVFGWLLLAGAAVMLVGLFLVTTFGGASPNLDYHPATLRDGQIVPGGFE
ncbi:MAG: hypothetical protein IT535_02655 [Bauldia sp.]|nr:hypothetical protein [Bauldia sp.]